MVRDHHSSEIAQATVLPLKILQEIIKECPNYYLDEIIGEMINKTGKRGFYTYFMEIFKILWNNKKEVGKAAKKGILFFCFIVLSQILPFMKPYPGKNSALMMDNAKIHHDEELIN
ncbi:unnamed protein product [Rhizophagus irregularis]|nr:unnamed protein product [Rhizophagus irregularis]